MPAGCFDLWAWFAAIAGVGVVAFFLGKALHMIPPKPIDERKPWTPVAPGKPDSDAIPPQRAKEPSEAEAVRQEIRDAIAWYDERGSCWISVVTFIGIRHLFGGWHQLVRDLRSWGRRS